VLHAKSLETLTEFNKLGDALVICNHRTRIDWMFLWGLGVAIGRLQGLKIVLKDGLRKAPGFGWACQCFGFPFMSRKSRNLDLATLTESVELHCEQGASNRLALLLFPEGTDLSESNLAKSHEYAKSKGLPCHNQILHPKTAGFLAAWKAITQAAPSDRPASLVDVTISYVGFLPMERPSETSVFLNGRCCREVHICVDVVQGSLLSSSEDPEALCRSLFADKEKLLSSFYEPCSAGGQPNTAALGSGFSASLEKIPGASLAMGAGIAFTVLVELLAFLAWRWVGWIPGLVVFFTLCGTFGVITFASGGIDRWLLNHRDQHPM